MPNFANSQKRENCSQLQIMKWPKVSIGKKIKVCDQLSLNRVRLTQIFASPDAEEEITLDIDSLSVSDALVHSHTQTYAVKCAHLRAQAYSLTHFIATCTLSLTHLLMRLSHISLSHPLAFFLAHIISTTRFFNTSLSLAPTHTHLHIPNKHGFSITRTHTHTHSLSSSLE